MRRSTAKAPRERRGPYMPVVLAACEEGGYAYEYHHGTIGYGVFTYALAKEFRKAQAARETDVSFTELNSGHGGQVPNTGNDLEPDGFDETWCLYDGELIDDELYAALKQFVKGVRIFVLSDSCHSGTVLRAIQFSALGVTPVRPRMMPRDVALRVYMDHQKFYDKLQQRSSSSSSHARMRATALLISGCQDNQTSADGDRNGLFTETVLAVWKNGKFKGDYRGFHKSIVKLMPPTQTPNFFTIGPANYPFEEQEPFTV